MTLDKKTIICGVDEAGRGALAGPVVAAAVILDSKIDSAQFRDSKIVTQLGRERLFELLKVSSSKISVCILDHDYIDTTNILKATLEAMKRSILDLDQKPDNVLIDGNRAPHLEEYSITTIVKGDQTEPSISAASIIAKVTRNRIMSESDRDYPGYGFLKNKGYGTRAHYDAIFELGPCKIHRKSFNLNRQQILF